MVGCLEKLSSSEWSLKKFKEVLKSKKRTNCDPPAPAYGLYLKNVMLKYRHVMLMERNYCHQLQINEILLSNIIKI